MPLHFILVSKSTMNPHFVPSGCEVVVSLRPALWEIGYWGKLDVFLGSKSVESLKMQRTVQELRVSL